MQSACVHVYESLPCQCIKVCKRYSGVVTGVRLGQNSVSGKPTGHECSVVLPHEQTISALCNWQLRPMGLREHSGSQTIELTNVPLQRMAPEEFYLPPELEKIFLEELAKVVERGGNFPGSLSISCRQFCFSQWRIQGGFTGCK